MQWHCNYWILALRNSLGSQRLKLQRLINLPLIRVLKQPCKYSRIASLNPQEFLLAWPNVWKCLRGTMSRLKLIARQFNKLKIHRSKWLNSNFRKEWFILTKVNTKKHCKSSRMFYWLTLRTILHIFKLQGYFHSGSAISNHRLQMLCCI